MRFTMGFGGGMKATTSPDPQRGLAPALPTGQKPSSVRNRLQFRQAHKKPLAKQVRSWIPEPFVGFQVSGLAAYSCYAQDRVRKDTSPTR
jgi:hypothetical protein